MNEERGAEVETGRESGDGRKGGKEGGTERDIERGRGMGCNESEKNISLHSEMTAHQPQLIGRDLFSLFLLLSFLHFFSFFSKWRNGCLIYFKMARQGPRANCDVPSCQLSFFKYKQLSSEAFTFDPHLA